VVEIQVIGRAVIEIAGALNNAYSYDPDEWQFQMDNARLDLGSGTRKYQGISLRAVLEPMEPQAHASTVVLRDRAGAEMEMELDEVMTNSSIRIFNVTAEEGLIFTVASDGGQIWLSDVVEIQVG
jgi:hypothetical protein